MRMRDKQQKLRECVEKWHEKPCFLQTALSATPIFLEVIWWNRMILDEFHEAESWNYPVREVMKSLGATHRWGVSGTPPLNSTDAVLEVAELLWFAKEAADEMAAPAMSQAMKFRNSQRQEALMWLQQISNQKQVEVECQAWIRDYVRQNTSELVEAIQVIEHEEFVVHSAEERLIYRQACHDHNIFDSDSYRNASLDDRAGLLKRCAHFCLNMGAEDATDAVRLLGARKRARIQALERQLEIEASRAAHLSCWLVCKEGLVSKAVGLRHPNAKAFIQKIHDSGPELLQDKDQKSLEMLLDLFDRNGDYRLRPEVRFQQPCREDDVYPRLAHRHVVWHAVADLTMHQGAKEILSETQVCQQVCCGDRLPQLQQAISAGFQSLAQSLDAAYRSLDFYTGQMKGISDPQQATCSICMEATSDLTSLVLLPCAHIFHRSCVEPVLRESPYCPYCRAPTPSRALSSVCLELEAGPGQAVQQEALSPELRSQGSKVLAIARRLQRIRAEDPEAKAIVFVQWQELEQKVAHALTCHGLPAWQLPRGPNATREMAQKMKDFCTSKESFVLLLSLEHAASGSNLTAAHHVIFVHPMNADTLSSAVAYEQQALARVRRVGQLRKEVHVWRFVTRDTVEEHLHQLHRAQVPTPLCDASRAAGA